MYINKKELVKYIAQNVNRNSTNNWGMENIILKKKTNRGRPTTMRGEEMNRRA